MTKLYGNRDIEQLERMGRYYSKHVSAMTKEGLEGKGDIAAELAYRDMLIDQLQAAIAMTGSTEHPVQMIERPRSAEDLVHEISENVKLLHAAAQAMRASMPPALDRPTRQSVRHALALAYGVAVQVIQETGFDESRVSDWRPIVQSALYLLKDEGETK